MTGSAGIRVDGGAMFAFDAAGALARAVTLNGGTLRYSSPANYSGALTFDVGTLAGTNWNGSALSGLTISADRRIAPGDSVGTAYATAQAWSDGGAYEFELADATGEAGTGWDLLAVAGLLDLSGLASAAGFTVHVTTLDAAGEAGEAQNFDADQPQQWTLATFESLAGDFVAARFAIDADGFANETKGSFKVVRDGDTLVLAYNPMRGTLVLLR